MREDRNLGVQVPVTYLPKKGIELTKWAVIACDQYTSQPEYWEEVADYVGDSPSTYHLILPEVYLGTDKEAQRVLTTQSMMRNYLSQGILEPHNRFIYVERTVSGKTRRGIMLVLDLEKYDFSAGSQSLIRATEGTILDRLPPRIRIRENASLELPHILVLIDDPEDRVIGTIEKQKTTLPVAYDFDLMKNSGHLCGRYIEDDQLEESVFGNLQALTNPEEFSTKYGVDKEKGILLFAVGDGNHSLATAKSIWEKVKLIAGIDHPARYALVEIENIHDKGLDFEPIHRVLFKVIGNPNQMLVNNFSGNLSLEKVQGASEMKSSVDLTSEDLHHFGLITSEGFFVGRISKPTANLAVGSLQPVLDRWIKEGSAESIDYVHGEETVFDLGSQPGNAGIYLPAMEKNELFRTVLLDGVLPRKTFSMGEAHEKRFYMEARKIVN